MNRTLGATPSYDEPFLWWGPVWAPPPPRTVVDLLQDGVMTPEVAALLWGALSRRRSIVVAAGPRGVGKSTLLTALLDFLPPSTRRLYLRGCYETFAFLEDAAIVPTESVLLVNEISAHLPAYLWGPAVRRLLQAKQRGFTFAATAHAATIQELVGQLAGYPLRVPLSEVAAIDLVLFLTEGTPRHRQMWQVGEIWTTTLDRQRGLSVTLLAADGELTDGATDLLSEAEGTTPAATEIARRGAFLIDLAGSKLELSHEQVRQALARLAGWLPPSDARRRM